MSRSNCLLKRHYQFDNVEGIGSRSHRQSWQWGPLEPPSTQSCSTMICLTFCSTDIRPPRFQTYRQFPEPPTFRFSELAKLRFYRYKDLDPQGLNLRSRPLPANLVEGIQKLRSAQGGAIPLDCQKKFRPAPLCAMFILKVVPTKEVPGITLWGCLAKRTRHLLFGGDSSWLSGEQLYQFSSNSRAPLTRLVERFNLEGRRAPSTRPPTGYSITRQHGGNTKSTTFALAERKHPGAETMGISSLYPKGIDFRALRGQEISQCAIYSAHGALRDSTRRPPCPKHATSHPDIL